MGGVYFDTDVELIKKIDHMLDNRAYFGFEGATGRPLPYYINTGEGFGAEKHTPILLILMDAYQNRSFIKEDGSFDITDCPLINTPPFVRSGFIMNNQYQCIEGVAIYPSDYFGPAYISKLCATENTISLHHYLGTWTWEFGTKDVRKQALKRKRHSLYIDIAKHPAQYLLKWFLGAERYYKLKQNIVRYFR